MKRWLVLFAVFAPNLSGCLAYAYPTLAHTPALTVPNQDGSVHAFRIDIDRTERTQAPTATQYTLARIPIDERGIIPSQLELAHASGTYDPLGVVDGAHERNQYTMLVRVYRPGSRSMEIKAWDKSRALQWSPAPDLLAQEKAIDDLLADPAALDVMPPPIQKGQPPFVPPTWWALKDEKKPGLGLQPGVESLSQRQALLFASSEYQRLAGSPLASAVNMQPARERLQQKAIWLRRYAEQGQ